MKRKPINSNLGSVTLLVFAGLLPIMLLFFSLTTDISKLYSSRERYQNILDEAVLLGLRYLPNSSVVENRVKAFIRTRDSKLAENVSTELLDTGVLKLTVEVHPDSFLARYFGLADSFTYWVQAKAQVVPRDVAIFLDTSDRLAPNFSNGNSLAWGGENWPPSRYFRDKTTTENENRLYTQQCFNPALSAYKEAAIRTLDYFSSFPQNNVGVLVGPGYQNISAAYEISVLKNLDNNAITETANFSFYRSNQSDEELSKISDENCLAIVDNAAITSGYSVPKPVSTFGIDSNYTWSGKITSDVLGIPKIKRNRVEDLNVRDVIWSRSVRESQDELPVHKIVKETSNMLFSGGLRAGEGDINKLLNSIGVIFLSEYPWHESETNRIINIAKSELRSALVDIDNQAKSYGKNLQIYFVNTKLLGTYNDSCINNNNWSQQHVCTDFHNDALAFNTFLKNIESGLSNTHLVAFRAPDTASIAQDLLAILPLMGQRYAKIS